MARRVTTWFWVALSFSSADVSETSLYGMQLSQGVYGRHISNPSCIKMSKECPTGDMENIMWFRNETHYLDTVLQITYVDENMKVVHMEPGKGQTKFGREISITSHDGNINLRYIPLSQVLK
jgi:hypothetical protein